MSFSLLWWVQAALELRMEEVRKGMRGEMSDTAAMDPEPADLLEHDRTGARPKRRR